MKSSYQLLFAIILLFSYNANAQNPKITSIAPTFGGPGDTIILTGNNFTNAGINSVKMSCGNIGEIAFKILSSSKIAIYLGVGTGQCTSTISINNNRTSLSSIGGFNWYAQPAITAVVPASAGAGDPVKIIGSRLAIGAKAFLKPTVSFGDVEATVLKPTNRDTIKAILGNGASGDVKLTTLIGVTSFSGFTFENIVKFCPTGGVSIPANIVGNNFRWQLNTGGGFADITNNSNYANATSATLSINNIPSSWSGYQYKCIVDNNTSLTYTLRIKNTWTGAQNNSWNNPANWSCGIIPDSNTDVIINSGNVVLNVNATIRTLNLNEKAKITPNSGNVLTVIY